MKLIRWKIGQWMFYKWRNAIWGKEKLVDAQLNLIHSCIKLFEHFHNLLKGKILDIGCGSMIRDFKLRGLNIREYILGNYFGIDPIMSWFDEEVGQYCCAIGEKLPFLDKTFDCILLRSVLDHVEQPLLVLKEAYRVLKDGGNIIIALSLLKLSPIQRLKLFIKGSLTKRLDLIIDSLDISHIHRFTIPNAIIELLERANFKLYEYKLLNKGIWIWGRKINND